MQVHKYFLTFVTFCLDLTVFLQLLTASKLLISIVEESMAAFQVKNWKRSCFRTYLRVASGWKCMRTFGTATTTTQLCSDRGTSKDFLNIGTIGDEKHGKTTLMNAILKYLSQDSNTSKQYNEQDINFFTIQQNKNKLGANKDLSQISSNIEYETSKRHYLHADNPGDPGYLPNLMIGSSQLECIILVCSVLDGINDIIKQQLYLISQMKIANIVVYLNKCDLLEKL